MRFLLVTIGTAGDVFPFLALGRRLQARGDDAAVITHTAYGESVRRAGLEFIDLDDAAEHRAMVEHPWFGHPWRSTAVTSGWVVDSMRRQFDRISQHYVPGETTLVSLVISFGARVFEERFDAPNVSVLISPLALRSRFRPSRLPAGWWPTWTPPVVNGLVYRVIDAIGIDRALAGINTFRRELGLPKAARYLHEWWQSPRGILALFPEWFVAPAPPDWPPQLRMTGFPLYDAAESMVIDPELAEFLSAGPAAVVTGGSWLRDRRFFESAIEGCRRAGLRCVVQTPFAELVADGLDGDVRHTRYAPFGQLFPHAAAVVHHGGVGTLAQALAAGTPQVVTPQNFDQRDNASRLTALGVADWAGNGRVPARTIARGLERVLESREVAAACRRCADLSGGDTVGRACDTLDALCGSRASVPPLR